ncbi:uncharacterized protein LOC144547145 isoform X2 [Carex rostrata]
MDFSNKIRSPNSVRSDPQRKSPKTITKVSHESNENSFTPNRISPSVKYISRNEHKNLKSPFTSPLSQKRILTEKNHLSNSSKKSSHQRNTDKHTPVSTDGSRPDTTYPLPYDPVTNYTSPRPEYLRYDPNRRMETMRRIEKAMLDEEEGISSCTSIISTSPQMPGDKVIEEEDRSQSNSSISTAPQVQMPVCEEEKCLSDEEEEGVSNPKLGLKLIFFLVCLVSSVCYIFSMSSNVDIKLHERTSEVSVLGEMIGLSKMCLNRRNVELTCGIEERGETTEEAIPQEFDISGFTFTPEEEQEMFNGGELEVTMETDEIGGGGFTPEEEGIFNGCEFEVTKETDEIGTGIGLLAQENNVEFPEEVELHAVGDMQTLERSEALKMQLYLFYSMQALACISVLAAMIAYLHKHTSNMFYKKKKQNRASETDVQRGLGAAKKPSDKVSTTIAGNSKMHVIQPPQVDLLSEFSLANTTMVNGSSVEEVELQAMDAVNTTMVQSPLKEVAQATPTAPITPGTLLEKNKNQRESTKSGVTPLRRSSRLRTRLTSP